MSQMSPAWQQGLRTSAEEQPANTRHPSSSDSDSGCPQEETLSITSDSIIEQVALKSLHPEETTVPPFSKTPHLIRTLLCQLPPQDSDERYCTSLCEEERVQLHQFSVQRRLQSVGQGTVQPVMPVQPGSLCERCGRKIPVGTHAVMASKQGSQSRWHPSCFVCSECEQPLFDFVYFHHNGQIYCGRHHAELFRPRCASCDQLIFTKELTEAEGWHWHLRHFCCTDCDTPLGGQRYVMKGAQPYCFSCFESSHAEACHTCGDTIGLDCDQVTHQGHYWHARTSCFHCSRCKRPLLGQEFLLCGDLLWCSTTCSTRQESSSSSDSSDSAFLSTPSPISRHPFRVGSNIGTRIPRVRPTDCKHETRDQQISSGNVRLASRHLGMSNTTKAPQATAQVHRAPEGIITVKRTDALQFPHPQKDTDSWDGNSSDSSQTRAPDLPAGNVLLSTAVWPGTHGICLKETSRRNQRSLLPYQSGFSPEPPAEGNESSPHMLSQHETAQQHTGLERSQLTPRHSIRKSSLQGPTERTEASTKTINSAPNKMAAEEQSLSDVETSSTTHVCTREEDSWCPTCSSSSDSEQEGYFLGRPIPIFTEEGNPTSGKVHRLQLKTSASSKHCTLS